ncbi:translation initiation factor IF-2-like [Schistocerca serialis cubense]|uniref:translation initiation factor IF-2-like n=1 Tax=Schistocerca serialis cubense TaxID=2023355 RepID=UPI00214E34D0|nr:translation initiation factor IF-2-like [Schistocerca serialis cubense]
MKRCSAAVAESVGGGAAFRTAQGLSANRRGVAGRPIEQSRAPVCLMDAGRRALEGGRWPWVEARREVKVCRPVLRAPKLPAGGGGGPGSIPRPGPRLARRAGGPARRAVAGSAPQRRRLALLGHGPGRPPQRRITQRSLGAPASPLVDEASGTGQSGNESGGPGAGCAVWRGAPPQPPVQLTKYDAFATLAGRPHKGSRPAGWLPPPARETTLAASSPQFGAAKRPVELTP